MRFHRNFRRLRWSLATIAAFGFSAVLHADDLFWNATTGSFTGSQTWDYNDDGVVATTDNPFSHSGTTGSGGVGANIAFVGNGGDVTLNSATAGFNGVTNGLLGLRVGTQSGAGDFTAIGGADRRGDGALTVAGGTSLTLVDPSSEPTDFGELLVAGAGGITGIMNWNSSGTLDAQARIRVGQGGDGTFNQNNGTVLNGQGEEIGIGFMGIGGLGGTGVYNLNNGTLQHGSATGFGGVELRRRFRIGLDNNSTGTLNVGDGVGAAGSARVETWDEIDIGEGTNNNNVLRIQSDGLIRARYAAQGVINEVFNAQAGEARIRIGLGGAGTGTIIQDGGTLHTDSRLEVGAGGTGTYDINGPGSTIMAQALTVGANGTLDYGFTSAGTSQITLEGSLNTAGDDELGVTLTSGATLTLTDFPSYNPANGDVVLVDQLDSSAQVTGLFDGLAQGAMVGTASGTDYFLNYFGGSNNNDIILQQSVTNSLTDGLVWNVGAANFTDGFAKSDGMFGVAAPGVSPFGSTEDLYLGNNGVATLNASGSVKSLIIGTNLGNSRIANTNGNGTLNASGSQSLTVGDGGVPDTGSRTGDLTVGSGGFTGTVNWNSSGTLAVEGKLRIGEGGAGVFNQTDGRVTGGDTGGPGKFLAIGSTAGSTGTYNLDAGTLAPGNGFLSPAPPNDIRRNLRIGDAGATGTLNVGDGVGAAESANIEQRDDIFVGNGGGTGVVNIRSDGLIKLETEGGNAAEFWVGRAGGNGTVNQTGGRVEADRLVTIGENGGSVGVYNLSGGSFEVLGPGQFRVGAFGGTGTFNLNGDASFTHPQAFLIAAGAGSGATGTVQITGSNVDINLAKLENDNGAGGPGNGNDETIRWVADAGGISTINVSGVGVNPDFVQLQDDVELSANTGSPGSLMGDGIALELDLSALSGTMDLILINNMSADPILGFFENGTSMDLYENGDTITGTGFSGTVTIDYFGGTGNDVVLSLVAGGLLFGDADNDGAVAGSDLLAVTNNFGNTGPADGLLLGDADDDGAVAGSDLLAVTNNFGSTLSSGNLTHATVPEPGAITLILAAGLALATLQRRNNRRAGV